MQSKNQIDYLILKGAREHNLKNLDLKLPRNQMIVITGNSGSGKSSLAFDTIYAEGQRRYVESLSTYSRQFLGQMKKPDIDYIEGLSPAISIEQKNTHHNPRSTVGTVTEIYDHLRLLYARCGIPHCPQCDDVVDSQSIDQMIQQILNYPMGTKIQILSPVANNKKGELKKEIQRIKDGGFYRIRIDNEFDTVDDVQIIKDKKHTLDVVIDRLVIKKDIRERLADSIETGLQFSQGIIRILFITPDSCKNNEILFSEHHACPKCNISLPEIQPNFFSFNSPQGSCPECHGLGAIEQFDPELIIPNPSLSLMRGGIESIGPLRSSKDWYLILFETLAKHYQFSLDSSISELPEKIINIILYGSGQELIQFKYNNRHGFPVEKKIPFEGIIPMMKRKYQDGQGKSVYQHYNHYLCSIPCAQCHGLRLRKESLAVRIDNQSIMDLCAFSIKESIHFFGNLKLSGYRQNVAEKIVKEIHNRLVFLMNVGLNYLSLNRKVSTLSGGEMQRIRLATQIGSQLVGVLYVLDEPSIGLHPKDNQQLIQTLLDLKNLGNTLIVVEHDEQTIMNADYIVDLGPGGGLNSGYIMAEGSPKQIIKNPKSITGKYLSRKRSIKILNRKRNKITEWIQLKGCAKNNLKNISVDIPLQQWTVVTGVSGSGKSTLINETLYPALKKKLNKQTNPIKGLKNIQGFEAIKKILNIDQSPIGRTPRSNPATYTGAFTPIREFFSNLTQSKMRGYSPGRFSFNVKGGRCEMCHGSGTLQIEMHFLSDIYIQCELCQGKRYNTETLQVTYKGMNINDILNMSVKEALELFQSHPSIEKKLQTLYDVGLGYILLGQNALTLSGGEAQRVKIATELSKRFQEQTLYILDEPTTGLHFEDIQKLIQVLNQLVEHGHTLIVIEHNLDVIKNADYLIDLGPDGGYHGGEVIAIGTPKQIAENTKSYTGKYLKQVLL